MREMIVPGMKVPVTEFGLSPFANGGAFGKRGRLFLFPRQRDEPRMDADGDGWGVSGSKEIREIRCRILYLEERWGMSLSTNNSRNRNIRGRFTSFLETRREISRVTDFLTLELRIFMRSHISTACAIVHGGEPSVFGNL